MLVSGRVAFSGRFWQGQLLEEPWFLCPFGSACQRIIAALMPWYARAAMSAGTPERTWSSQGLYLDYYKQRPVLSLWQRDFRAPVL